jgi:hypothetical protein
MSQIRRELSTPRVEECNIRRSSALLPGADRLLDRQVESFSLTSSKILEIVRADLLVAGDPEFVPAVCGPADATGTRVVLW